MTTLGPNEYSKSEIREVRCSFFVPHQLSNVEICHPLSPPTYLMVMKSHEHGCDEVEIKDGGSQHTPLACTLLVTGNSREVFLQAVTSADDILMQWPNNR